MMVAAQTPAAPMAAFGASTDERPGEGGGVLATLSKRETRRRKGGGGDGAAPF
jgi:hypothetical protein